MIDMNLLARSQEFDIQLSGVNYHLSVTYRGPAGWTLDIMTQDKELILAGIPIVSGVDILEQYQYMGFKGSLFFVCEDMEDELSYEQFGVRNKLYFKTIDG
ncbi:hypothetical protein EX227_02800 [Providencia rettgeri]|uniref:Cyanophage baseplate Pam3 plug gp18 domain-containing protein n=2 Tax=Providencia rettgeri TaxID=587 RepID=A0AAP2JWS1_PRORE|nr:hypothetical protein [Providencia rettgeri]ELR5225891.1 hypothetical protein [Providencia rettgeri]MBX6956720.1 hypothetical protein [Providencia rettgeri]MBX6960494.1 hypothetical protein [Providencia rettgeri]MBX6970651.1 hypothetical protein [Providencia rettgeri]MBX6980113.1 hypothetical protein [Providencia rettgeri]